jgi:hypothetical protein
LQFHCKALLTLLGSFRFGALAEYLCVAAAVSAANCSGGLRSPKILSPGMSRRRIRDACYK